VNESIVESPMNRTKKVQRSEYTSDSSTIHCLESACESPFGSPFESLCLTATNEVPLKVRSRVGNCRKLDLGRLAGPQKPTNCQDDHDTGSFSHTVRVLYKWSRQGDGYHGRT
jgi:hypothetical protein